MVSAPVNPAFADLYALAIQARHTVISRLLQQLAVEKYPEYQRRLLTLLLRATASPILAARASLPRSTPNFPDSLDPRIDRGSSTSTQPPTAHVADRPNGATQPPLAPINHRPNGPTQPPLAPINDRPNGATQPEPRATPWVDPIPNPQALKGRPSSTSDPDAPTNHTVARNPFQPTSTHPTTTPAPPALTHNAPPIPTRPSKAAALLAAAGAPPRPP